MGWPVGSQSTARGTNWRALGSKRLLRLWYADADGAC